jgi:hypothetical protein
MTPMVDESLAATGQRIDDLEARIRVHTPERRLSMRRHAVALRHEQANALAAARRAPAQTTDERAARLRSRLEVAEHSLDADLAEDRSAFTAAVEAELESWDRFIERLLTRAAEQTGPARDHAEAAITALRRQRISVNGRLDAVRAAGWNTWREERTRVSAARDQLEQMADDLSATLY